MNYEPAHAGVEPIRPNILSTPFFRGERKSQTLALSISAGVPDASLGLQ
jgi:hypothetical protein